MRNISTRLDAGIIAMELRRARLDEDVDAWGNLVRNGVCTLDLKIGKWVRSCFGKNIGADETQNTMSFDEL